MNELWGLLIIISGVFVCAYGIRLFRFALAALGFGIGAILGWWLTGSASSEVGWMPYLVSLALGGIGALLLYSLVKVGIYIAGGVLGLVLTFLLIAVLDIRTSWLVIILLIAGTGLVSFFGRRLGNTIIALAMAAAGAFQVIYGLSLLFADQIVPDADPTVLLDAPLALAVFLAVAAVSALGQLQRRTGVVQVIR